MENKFKKLKDDDPIWNCVVFMTMDRNNNGFLTEAEIREYSKFFDIKIPGLREGTTFFEEIYANLHFLLADKKITDTISWEEYLLAEDKFNKLKDDDPMYYRAFFMTMDRNDNGFLTETEIREYFNFFEIKVPGLKEGTIFFGEVYANIHFLLLDKKPSDTISFEEYLLAEDKFNKLKDDDPMYYRTFFMTMDRNDNGFLTEAELRKFSKFFEIKMP